MRSAARHPLPDWPGTDVTDDVGVGRVSSRSRQRPGPTSPGDGGPSLRAADLRRIWQVFGQTFGRLLAIGVVEPTVRSPDLRMWGGLSAMIVGRPRLTALRPALARHQRAPLLRRGGIGPWPGPQFQSFFLRRPSLSGFQSVNIAPPMAEHSRDRGRRISTDDPNDTLGILAKRSSAAPNTSGRRCNRRPRQRDN